MYVAGFTIAQLQAAGITIAQMLAAGITIPPANPVISSINGTSPTILNPTVSITINPSSIDSSTTNYYYSIDGLSFMLLNPAQNTSTLSIPISGLTSGTSHTFAIKAYNGSDSIASATSAPTTVYIPPAQPVISSVNGTSPTILNPTVSITINPSSIDSSTTNYSYSIDGLPFVLLSPTQTISALSNVLTIPISGLTSDTNHTFTIKAYNGSNSIASETSAPTTVYIPPTAPTNLVATISPTNSNTALIAFEQTEKDTITSYTYASSIDGGATYSDFSSINLTLISATQISISGLTITNGTTYYFKLKSCNGVNSYSIESTPSNIILENFAQPAPKIQIVSAVNKELSISFTQDKYAIAYDISSYECSINGGLTYITIPNTTSPFKVPLSSSTNATYSVILKANNGLLSVASNTFTLRKINRIGNIV